MDHDEIKQKFLKAMPEMITSRHAKVTFWFHTTLGSHHRASEMHFAALKLGLRCTFSTSRGWLSREHIFVVEGDGAQVAAWCGKVIGLNE